MWKAIVLYLVVLVLIVSVPFIDSIEMVFTILSAVPNVNRVHAQTLLADYGHV
jgi:hypothetical protein